MALNVLKQHDLEPVFDVTLRENGSPLSLTDAERVRVIGVMDGVVVVDRDISPDAGGQVQMPWAEGETAQAGVMALEVEVTWPGQRPQTFPREGQIVWFIVRDLA